MRALLFLSILILPLTTFSQNEIKLNDGEKIILEKRGNYLAKVFSQPGKAYVTNERFYFITTKLATKKFEHSIPVSNIKSVSKTKYNLKLGIASANAITLTLKNGEEMIFVVPKRKKWIAVINKLI